MLSGILIGSAGFYGFVWFTLAETGELSTTFSAVGLSMFAFAGLYGFVVFKYGGIGQKVTLAVTAAPIWIASLLVAEDGTASQRAVMYGVGRPWVGFCVFAFLFSLFAIKMTGKDPFLLFRTFVVGRAFGAAQWASWWRLKRAGMFEKGGLFLGRSRGKDIYHNVEGHLFTIGGTGGGKSSGLVVPALLELTQGSVIVTDPSGELSAITMRHRSTLGDVVLLNPFADIFRQGTGLEYPDHGFNPLSAIDPTSTTFKAECDALARLLMVTDRRDSGSYWNDEGAAFLALMIAATLLYEDKKYHTLTHLFALVRSRTDLIAERLEKIIKHDHPAFRDEAGGFLDVITDSPPQWQGMVRKAATATARYAPTTPLGEHVSKDGFDVADLKRKDVTVYILVPPSQLPTALPWMNLLVGVFSRAIGAPGQARQVTLLIDETPSLGFLPDLQFCMAQFRKVGLRVWLFTQTMSQMQAPELYGREGFEALFGLCTIKQFFALDEPEAQAKLSQLCGERTARNIADNAGGRNIADVGVPLMRPEEARRLSNWKQVIIKSGMSDPIKGKLVPYFKRKRWRGIADPNPYRDGSPQLKEASPQAQDSRSYWNEVNTPEEDEYYELMALKPPSMRAWVFSEFEGRDEDWVDDRALTNCAQILCGALMATSWILAVAQWYYSFELLTGAAIAIINLLLIALVAVVRAIEWMWWIHVPLKKARINARIAVREAYFANEKLAQLSQPPKQLEAPLKQLPPLDN